MKKLESQSTSKSTSGIKAVRTKKSLSKEIAPKTSPTSYKPRYSNLESKINDALLEDAEESTESDTSDESTPSVRTLSRPAPRRRQLKLPNPEVQEKSERKNVDTAPLSPTKSVVIKGAQYAIIVIFLIMLYQLYTYTSGGWHFNFSLPQYRSNLSALGKDPRSATYLFDGTSVTLKNGVSTISIKDTSGASTNTDTHYTAQEATADLNHDGSVDTVSFITQSTGGTGTFYYVVTALSTKDGYIGSHAFSIGDRITPQSLEIRDASTTPTIIVKYLDRRMNESFTTPPSIEKSMYLRLRTATTASSTATTSPTAASSPSSIDTPRLIQVLNTEEYDMLMEKMANYPAPKIATTTTTVKIATSTAASTSRVATTTRPTTPLHIWPARIARDVYPNIGALLPYNRIIAYYGNFYSKNMGILGEYPKDEMLKRLRSEVANWNQADPSTPAIPAIHYIVSTAQGSPSKTGLYIARMPDSQIDQALALAKEVDGIVFLDIQLGQSTLATELPFIKKYLELPNVHLGIDPEFAMKKTQKPGRIIGSMDAVDINYAINYLAKIVKDNNLPPKVLVVHRFTEAMVTNYDKITPVPEVQVVVDMDGWGSPQHKTRTYNDVVYSEPIQFTGFKIFYKNDVRPPSTRLITPAELLKLRPQPIYIQYQ